MAVQLEVKVERCPSNSLALTNQVFFHPQEAKWLMAVVPETSVVKEKYYVQIHDHVYIFRENDKILPGAIGMSVIQRATLNAAINDTITATTYIPDPSNSTLGTMHLEVDLLVKRKKVLEIFDGPELKEIIIAQLEDHIFRVEQQFILHVKGTYLAFKVLELQVMNDSTLVKADRGILTTKTELSFERASHSPLLLHKGIDAPRLWSMLENIGLEKSHVDVLRRAFGSRLYSPQNSTEHIRGILVYGTSANKIEVASRIGKLLSGNDHKFVNGPQLISVYVGQSEQNVRNLFKDAEAEYARRGSASELHVIIINEFEAIASHRGHGNIATDGIVHQLLSKLDGVTPLNNVLVIGIANNKSEIDSTLLKVGRLELHIEIPDDSTEIKE